MRVGLMAPPWVAVPPHGYGGTEAVVDRLARGIVAAGHDVLLWTTGDATCPVPRGHVYAAAQADRMGIAATELHHVISGYGAMIQWQAEIVHDHTLIGPVYALRYPDLPVITTNHGPFNAELTELYRALCPRVPVIAISHDQARRAGDLPVAAVIHHGIDLDHFPAGGGTGDDRGPYLLFLGRMAPEKGARRAALAARRAGARLKIAARVREPLEHAFFSEQIRPLLTDDIVFLGEVDHRQKVALLGGASALLNPIRWPEPFGLVMIEALACGAPVLSFREGAAPELIEHGVTGYLCDHTSDLVQHIGDLGRIDRAACRRAAETRFTTDRMVADHLEVYARVVNGWTS